MKSNPSRRRPQPEPEDPPSPLQRWRMPILIATIAAVAVFAWRTGGAAAPLPSVHGKVLAPPTVETYQLQERSWAGRSEPAADQPEADPEQERLLAQRARQWQNMDISIETDR